VFVILMIGVVLFVIGLIEGLREGDA